MPTKPKTPAPIAAAKLLQVATPIAASIYGALADRIFDVPDGHTAEKVADEALDAAAVLIRKSGERA